MKKVEKKGIKSGWKIKGLKNGKKMILIDEQGGEKVVKS